MRTLRDIIPGGGGRASLSLWERAKRRPEAPEGVRADNPALRTDPPFHLYLSHASADFLLVERVWRILDSIGLRAYMYEHNTHPGRSPRDAVLGAIADSAEVVSFLTEAGAGSAWVHQELGAVHALGKGLIPWLDAATPQAPGFAEFDHPVLYDPRRPEAAIAALLWLVRHDFDLFEGLLNIECPQCRNFLTFGLPGVEQCRNAQDAGTLLTSDPCPRCRFSVYISPWTLEPIAEQLALSRAWSE